MNTMHIAGSGTSAAGGDTRRLMPAVGDVVAGKYLIVRVLGEGGMGIVYEATHQRLRQRVAIKMLLPTMLEHQVIVSRFEREARAAAQLRGRHVARVNDVDVTADGLPYMVMDFLEGHDLQVEIEKRGTLPIPEAVDYILQACAAMVEAHALGIVHRDLKPSNLFLEQDFGGTTGPQIAGGPRVVKVLDFGISKVQADADAKLTEVDTVMGTALYMSPEQVRASHLVDARADIWALGVILYESFAGRVPWLGTPHQVAAAIVTEDAPDIRSFCPSVPHDLAAVIHKTLQREPANRFHDVRQLATALAPYAPAGSVGRNFADNVVATGSYPRVSITPNLGAGGIPSLVNEPSGDNAKTIINAPGVGEELMRPPSTDGGPPAGISTGGRLTGSRGRAALVGVLVAFSVTLVSIGAVVLFIHRRQQNDVKPEATTTAASSTAATQAPPSDPSSSVAPSSSPSTPSSSSTSLAAGSATASKPKPGPTIVTTRPSATTTTSTKPSGAQPTTKPSQSAAPVDKPLFL